MAAARPDINYEILALDGVMQHDPPRIQRLLADLADGLADGEIAPLRFEAYPLAEATTAFRRMQQARHIGKIILQMPKPLQPQSDRSYLITGGLGALGLHTAAYLAQLGAGSIVLTGRRMPDAGPDQAIAEIWSGIAAGSYVRGGYRRRGSSQRSAGADQGGVAAARWRGAPGGRAR